MGRLQILCAVVLLVAATLRWRRRSYGGYRIDHPDLRSPCPVGGTGADRHLDTRAHLTDLGRRQAAARRAAEGNHYDGIFASTMIRTRSRPPSPCPRPCRNRSRCCPGCGTEAGQYEGQPEASVADTYRRAAAVAERRPHWPGSPDAGRQRVRRPVRRSRAQQIYDSGDDEPVAYSHGWCDHARVMMNVRNPIRVCCGHIRWTTPTTSSSPAT